MVEIPLDIGVIMTCPTDWVFLEMVERYPGARYFYNNFVDSCECGDPSCARKLMQGNIDHLFEDDKKRLAAFFEALSKFTIQPTPEQQSHALKTLGYDVSFSKRENDEIEDFKRQLADAIKRFKD